MTTTALIPYEAHLDLMCDAGLLCDVCQQQPWTQMARWCNARICADCARGEQGEDHREGTTPWTASLRTSIK